jgi:hydrogenase maturation protease
LSETAGPGAAHTLILGLGNPLRGDDGAGVAVVEAISQNGPLPAGTRLIDLGTGDLLTALMEADLRRVIVVDAAEMGARPGEWRCFSADQARIDFHHLRAGASSHGGGLEAALALREALEMPPAEVTVYGIQPLAAGYGPGLSPEVKAAVHEVCEAIGREASRQLVYH